MKLLLSKEKALLSLWRNRLNSMPDYNDEKRRRRTVLARCIEDLEKLIIEQEARRI